MSTDTRSFKGSVVVITGASAGVGRATARAFARRGASVGLLARGEDGLRATRAEIEELGGRALDVKADVADAEAVEAAAVRIEAELGPIDIWINNAMASVFMPVWEMSADDFRRVTEVTYLGYVYGTMAALRRMRPRDKGVIVQVGSALAYRGIPLQSPYCGAKHAVQGFNESVRCELLHFKSNVRVTMVQLPALNTPQFGWVKTSFAKHPQPVPPIYQPELAADAIVWASRSARREVNVAATTTATILADKLAPGLLDRYLGRTGFDSQQSDRPIEPDRTDNLWDAVGGDHGAHGEFDDRAHGRSLQWWATRHRLALVVIAAVIGFLIYLLAGA
ncbi:MAG TPA: SDR family oxidoreductase [Actinomycetota bacterium]|nr:SDR family oxidoreductase [Actinomycetota bacterium]